MAGIQKEKFSSQVFQYIQDGIMEGRYRPGDRLVETQIAKELNLSQSPVREALRELETMGLIEVKPYSGCYVREMQYEELKQAYDLRSLIEKYAVDDAMPQITDEDIQRMEDAYREMLSAAEKQDRKLLVEEDVLFHRVMIQAAHNPLLERVWRMIGASQWTHMTIHAAMDIGYFPRSHEKLLDLVKNRDTEGYKKELEVHFKTASEIRMSRTGI